MPSLITYVIYYATFAIIPIQNIEELEKRPRDYA
jgi:hypothetical protein